MMRQQPSAVSLWRERRAERRPCEGPWLDLALICIDTATMAIPQDMLGAPRARSWVLMALVPLALPFVVLLLPIFAVASYLLAWYTYFTMAQAHLPEDKSTVIGGLRIPYLPLHPVRILKVSRTVVATLVATLFGPGPGLALRWVFRKLMTPRSKRLRVCEEICYNTDHPDVKLDVYCASLGFQQQHPHGHYWYEADGQNSRCTITAAVKDNVRSKLRPVVIFIYGGAWMSGDKAIYGPLAYTLQSQGYCVVVPNYTLFPKGKVGDMVADVYRAIQWTHDHIESFGGNPQQIFLMGHSAGAHLCMTTVLHDLGQYLTTRFTRSGSETSPNESSDPSPLPTLEDSLPQIQGMILLAGVYDIESHYRFESQRGLEEISGMGRAMGNTLESWDCVSPVKMLEAIRRRYPESVHNNDVSRLLPPNIWLVHGEFDTTVPASSSEALHQQLLEIGASNVKFSRYSRLDHQRPVVELMVPSSDYALEFLADLDEFTAPVRYRPEVRSPTRSRTATASAHQ
ncbi:Alpha/Beta hydrolase protein [Polychytrium aggregatum]|uniref:Alpha/Beta hydrolase protein n=1 Tax=Polychytrium aggregatum TaxID=110093 RepID=UPI0022FE1CAF|nr:Alpha/Beta hydrolase protein [Polychytrium aggregatum]KAI9209752.1 Alpha/Beta hydrolase protein [Polychytrium aggregatum]